jgi:GNAT superfamily N-acetyltransferase
MVKFKTIDIISATKSHAGELVDFHNRAYNSQRKPEDWLWQYQRYLPEKAVFVVARQNDKIIGTQAAMPYYLSVGESKILTGKSENTLLLPEYRGKGIMEGLYEYMADICAERGFRCLWGFTSAVKAFKRFKFSSQPLRLNWYRAGLNVPSVVFHGLLKPNSLKLKILSTGSQVLKQFMAFPQLFSFPLWSEHYSVVISDNIEPEDIISMNRQSEAHQSDSVKLRIDDAFLRWRMKENPNLAYVNVSSRLNKQLHAFAFVTNVSGTFRISHFGFNDESAFMSLLYRVIKKNNVRAGSFELLFNPSFQQNSGIEKMVKDIGFRNISPTNFVWRILDSNCKSILSDVSKWDLTGFFTEGYYY